MTNIRYLSEASHTLEQETKSSFITDTSPYSEQLLYPSLSNRISNMLAIRLSVFEYEFIQGRGRRTDLIEISCRTFGVSAQDRFIGQLVPLITSVAMRVYIDSWIMYACIFSCVGKQLSWSIPHI